VKKLTASLLVTAGALALSASMAAPALTAAPPPVVTITHNNGGTQVGTGLPGQPLVSVSDDSRGICVGFSYQMGSCPVGPIN
jgi:hypothetical protein